MLIPNVGEVHKWLKMQRTALNLNMHFSVSDFTVTSMSEPDKNLVFQYSVIFVKSEISSQFNIVLHCFFQLLKYWLKKKVLSKRGYRFLVLFKTPRYCKRVQASAQQLLHTITYKVLYPPQINWERLQPKLCLCRCRETGGIRGSSRPVIISVGLRWGRASLAPWDTVPCLARSSPRCLPHLTLLVTAGGVPAAGELPSSLTGPAATGQVAQTTAGKHGCSQHTNRAGKPGEELVGRAVCEAGDSRLRHRWQPLLALFRANP